MKNITPNYCSFEQCKWLKEKGFDLVTRTAYDYKIYQPSNLFHENIEVINNAKNYSNSEYERFQRPEQWQVIEWASLVHNIDIEARPVRYAGDIKTSYYQPYINGCIVNMSKFATRQEALSEAINEFLKMI
jgi:hypothetical protein